MKLRDYYQILGVSYTASDKEIRGAYRKQMLQAHPDVAEDTSDTSTAKILNEASSVLLDAERRARYDAFLDRKRRESASATGPFADIDFGFATEDETKASSRTYYSSRRRWRTRRPVNLVLALSKYFRSAAASISIVLLATLLICIFIVWKSNIGLSRSDKMGIKLDELSNKNDAEVKESPSPSSSTTAVKLGVEVDTKSEPTVEGGIENGKQGARSKLVDEDPFKNGIAKGLGHKSLERSTLTSEREPIDGGKQIVETVSKSYSDVKRALSPDVNSERRPNAVSRPSNTKMPGTSPAPSGTPIVPKVVPANDRIGSLRVAGEWLHYVNQDQPIPIKTERDGTASNSRHRGTWTLNADKFVLRWNDARVTGGAWVDSCSLVAGDRIYIGNNQNSAMIYGLKKNVLSPIDFLSPMVGSNGGAPFGEICSLQRDLVGFRIGTSKLDSDYCIGFLQPIYVGDDGKQFDGPMFGKAGGKQSKVLFGLESNLEKIEVFANNNINGLVFHLKPNSSLKEATEIKSFGSPKVGARTEIDMRMKKLIGIYGRVGNVVDALGFVLSQ